ncbi:MAG: bifunctional alpha,alpha-trehalose-phosphate synthase (UDP-forming)/trehalose-phosphatase [Bacteroidota bacterium]|nr:bifunctional alpha,alpha-trehalose-phosphate synthase (UDP-forming)/trehalose-phosphatase [Bacteroidota bacterium]
MSRLIVISNRLPFSLDTSREKAQIRQSSGGLVSALKGYFEQTSNKENDFEGKIWVGSCDFLESEWHENKDSLQGTDFSIEPIFLDKELYSDYYNGFSNSTIWPLFHYFPSMTEYKKHHFDAYYQVNRLFSDRIIEIMQPGDVIWVHDYQLMILPQMLRQSKPDATIGFFLHIPFPSYEIFRLIPREWKTMIIQGMLGADLVGFHTYDYAQYFINSAKMILGADNHYNTLTYQNRMIRADLFPIGIDFKKFKTASEDKEVIAYKNQLLENFVGKKIIFSVDRLDYTKGLTHRLAGFENFLRRFSCWREKVVFILNIVPSRDNIPAYNERKRTIEEMVSTINGKYSTIQWQPIIYRYNHLPFNELSGLYVAANIALITPLRDGMNLVAKEYVASCKEGGVLILSELTGAASELSEACHVNPTDAEEIADSIASALNMPLEEQKQRMNAMQKRLSDYDVVQWVNDFLGQLFKIKIEQKKLDVKRMDTNVISKLQHDYKGANKRCILLDYDGTLAPLKKMPSQAAPDSQVLDFLEQLTLDEKNEVVIISGRDADTLHKWLGHLQLHFIAEHGATIRYKNGDWQLQSSVSTDWKNEIRPMIESYVWRCAGSFLEEKQHTLSWHYRNTYPELGFARSRELLNNLLQLTTNSPLQVVDGNKVLEVRLTGMNKGMTALKAIDMFSPDFTLCIGDDTTDEDMFKALEGKAYTIKVGNGSTAANFNLHNQAEVLPLLKKIASFEKVEERQANTV